MVLADRALACVAGRAREGQLDDDGRSYLALFVGIVIMGWVGSFYEAMSNAAFWTLDAAIAFVGALVILAVSGR